VPKLALWEGVVGQAWDRLPACHSGMVFARRIWRVGMTGLLWVRLPGDVGEGGRRSVSHVGRMTAAYGLPVLLGS
jgi:hypothetical protein